MSTPKTTALVTGASRGIGAEVAQQLARDGFHVVVNYSSSADKAQVIVDAIEKSGGSAEAMGFNVSSSAEVEDAFKKLSENRPPLEVLVNNAGVTADALLMRLKDEDLDRVLNINLKGAIYCARAASRPMMKARKGSIIQISSVAGEMGNPGQAAYCAAKAGLIGFTKSAARELASRGIRVNCVTPGFIVTDMTGVLTDTQKEAMLRTIPLGEFGQVTDIAQTVSFLASEKSRYITGQVLGVNGGMYM